MKNEKFILMGHSKSSKELTSFTSWFRKNNFHPNIVNVFDHVEVVLLQVQHSNSVTVLSNNSPYRSFRSLIAIPIEDPIKIHNSFVWLGKNPNKHISLFTKEYKEWYLNNHYD